MEDHTMCPTYDPNPPTPTLERGPDGSPIIELPAILDRARSEILTELAYVKRSLNATRDDMTAKVARRDELQRQLAHIDAALDTLNGRTPAAETDGEDQP
jgi:hypothetical protein